MQGSPSCGGACHYPFVHTRGGIVTGTICQQAGACQWAARERAGERLTFVQVAVVDARLAYARAVAEARGRGVPRPEPPDLRIVREDAGEAWDRANGQLAA